jgi:hypothetical protein
LFCPTTILKLSVVNSVDLIDLKFSIFILDIFIRSVFLACCQRLGYEQLRGLALNFASIHQTENPREFSEIGENSNYL